MPLNELDCTLLEESLLNLLAHIQENIPNLTHTPGETITENIFAISSARKKLKEIREKRSQDFSGSELKVMYWAIYDHRDMIRDFLETAPLSDPDRDTAIEMQKTCNRILRDFAARFAKDGIDIHKYFDDL